MAKPIFVQGSDYAFDTTEEHTFMYNWNSSNIQSVANILTIRDNDTLEIIYQEPQNTLLLKHVLPANILSNGTLYNATIKVVDRDGNESSESDSILFYCFSKPIVTPTINDNEVIQNSSCTVGINYYQAEGEELQSFKVELYNKNKELIYTSSIKYDISSTVTLTDLEDNTTYYIKIGYETINHMQSKCDFIAFHVDYIAPDFYAYITVENRFKFGDIQFTSNLVSVEGKSSEIDLNYINNDKVDLKNGEKVIFDENFNLNNNYSLIIRAENLQTNKIFTILKNENNTVSLKWRIDEEENFYVELTSQSNNLINIFMSNHIQCTETDMIKIMVRCLNHRFDILVRKEEL